MLKIQYNNNMKHNDSYSSVRSITEPTSPTGTNRGESGPVRSIVELEAERTYGMSGGGERVLPVKSIMRSSDERSKTVGDMEKAWLLITGTVRECGDPVSSREKMLSLLSEGE